MLMITCLDFCVVIPMLIFLRKLFVKWISLFFFFFFFFFFLQIYNLPKYSHTISQSALRIMFLHLHNIMARLLLCTKRIWGQVTGRF